MKIHTVRDFMSLMEKPQTNMIDIFLGKLGPATYTTCHTTIVKLLVLYHYMFDARISSPDALAWSYNKYLKMREYIHEVSGDLIPPLEGLGNQMPEPIDDCSMTSSIRTKGSIPQIIMSTSMPKPPPYKRVSRVVQSNYHSQGNEPGKEKGSYHTACPRDLHDAHFQPSGGVVATRVQPTR
jgi:hypothetical protein